VCDGTGVDKAQHDSISINGWRVGKPATVLSLLPQPVELAATDEG